MRCDLKDVSIWIFGEFFFFIFTYIFGHRDLDLWPKVTNFNRVWASVLRNYLAKTASKSVHPFGWNFVHKNSGHTHTQTHRHTYTQTNCNENITPPRFRGGVKMFTFEFLANYFHKNVRYIFCHSDLDGRWRSQAKVKGHKSELMVICRKLLHSQTSYLVPRYNIMANKRHLMT